MTHDATPAGEMPAITSTPTKWFCCGGLGCLWGPSLAGDFYSPEAILAAMPEVERVGWTVAAGNIWCPHHEDSGRLMALRGCDECTMPGGKHSERCARLLAEKAQGVAHAEAVKRDPYWMSSDVSRLQQELREARTALSALLLPTGHLMGEGEACTPECQEARRIAGVTYDERHLPLGVTVTPPMRGVQLVQSLADIEGGFKRGHVTMIGSPMGSLSRRLLGHHQMLLGMEDMPVHQTLAVDEVGRVLHDEWTRARAKDAEGPAVVLLQRIAMRLGVVLLNTQGGSPYPARIQDAGRGCRILQRVARFALGDAALVMTEEEMWRALSPVLVRKWRLADEHAEMERRLEAMAKALTDAVEAERTARAAVRLARADLPGVYVWEGTGASDVLALKGPVIMEAATCRDLLQAAAASGQGGVLAGDIADVARARTLLGVKPGARLTPVVEGLREVFRELNDSHLEMHDWDAQLDVGDNTGLSGAGLKAFEDIGRCLKAATIIMGGSPFSEKP